MAKCTFSSDAYTGIIRLCARTRECLIVVNMTIDEYVRTFMMIGHNVASNVNKI